MTLALQDILRVLVSNHRVRVLSGRLEGRLVGIGDNYCLQSIFRTQLYQKDRQTNRQTDREQVRQTYRQTDKQTDRQTDRQKNTQKQTNKNNRDRKTHTEKKQKNRQTTTQTETNKDRDADTDTIHTPELNHNRTTYTQQHRQAPV